MKKLAIGFVIATVAFGVACTEAPVSPEQVDVSAAMGKGDKGNGAPSGSHYQVNLIGVANNGGASNNNDGRRIFVPLYGNCRIDLREGSFKVLDHLCGFDGDAAQFQLPNPVASDGTTSAYSVYVRALGKPGGRATMTTCFQEAGATTTTWCSAGVVFERQAKSRFSNVTNDLLRVCAYDADAGRYRWEGLFAQEGADYWWEYDNQGLRVAQMRFYPVGTPNFVGGDC